MFGASLSLSSSTSASSAAGQGDFNLNGGSAGKMAWLPWVIIGAVGIVALILFRKR